MHLLAVTSRLASVASLLPLLFCISYVVALPKHRHHQHSPATAARTDYDCIEVGQADLLLYRPWQSNTPMGKTSVNGQSLWHTYDPAQGWLAITASKSSNTKGNNDGVWFQVGNRDAHEKNMFRVTQKKKSKVTDVVDEKWFWLDKEDRCIIKGQHYDQIKGIDIHWV